MLCAELGRILRWCTRAQIFDPARPGIFDPDILDDPPWPGLARGIPVLIAVSNWHIEGFRCAASNKGNVARESLSGSLGVPLGAHVWHCIALGTLTTSICAGLVQIYITTEDRDSWLKKETVAGFFQDSQSFSHNPLPGRECWVLPSRSPNVKLTDNEHALTLQTVPFDCISCHYQLRVTYTGQ